MGHVDSNLFFPTLVMMTRSPWQRGHVCHSSLMTVIAFSIVWVDELD